MISQNKFGKFALLTLNRRSLSNENDIGGLVVGITFLTKNPKLRAQCELSRVFFTLRLFSREKTLAPAVARGLQLWLANNATRLECDCIVSQICAIVHREKAFVFKIFSKAFSCLGVLNSSKRSWILIASSFRRKRVRLTIVIFLHVSHPTFSKEEARLHVRASIRLPVNTVHGIHKKFKNQKWSQGLYTHK